MRAVNCDTIVSGVVGIKIDSGVPVDLIFVGHLSRSCAAHELQPPSRQISLLCLATTTLTLSTLARVTPR